MGSIESHLQVVNNTNLNITNTSVSGCDNYDWDRGSNCRPDRNFQGHHIACRGGSVTQRAELYKDANHCPFNMTLTFSDGSVDEFRIHQRYAIGCCAGFERYRVSHDIFYHRSGNTLVIKVENTEQQLQNQRAEEKNRNGEAALRQKQYEAALRHFDEALRQANQGSTINTIKNNKSEACYQIGITTLSQAFNLEADTTQDKSEEAQKKFNEAKNMLQQAQSLCNTSQRQQTLTLVNMKIDGNRLYNEANQLEQQAFSLFEGGDYVLARNKYNEALNKYKEAAEKFKEGSAIDKEKFDDSVTLTNDHIQDVEKVIDKVEKTELSYNLQNVKVGEEENKENKNEENVDIKLEKQVDILTE